MTDPEDLVTEWREQAEDFNERAQEYPTHSDKWFWLVHTANCLNECADRLEKVIYAAE